MDLIDNPMDLIDDTNSFTPMALPKTRMTGTRNIITRPMSCTAPRSKRTVIRKKCRPHSSSALVVRDNQSCELGSTVRPDSSMKQLADISDYISADIFDDSGWDTDCENEDASKNKKDYCDRTMYLDACRYLKVIPASYFLRHMYDSKLQMKHHGLGANGIKPIAAALVSNTHILQLCLEDNWLCRQGSISICNMLKENCYIYDLDLSNNNLDCVFANMFAEVLAVNVTLTRITLTGNSLDDKAAEAIANALMRTVTVEYLNLSHNQLGIMAGIVLGPAISENSSLKHLDLSWNSIRGKGAIAIANGIKHNVLLSVVNLSWNGFGVDGMQALGDALKANSALCHLNITNNRITTEGAVLLGKGLAINDTLKVLKMGQNIMQSAGCYAICAAILKNPNCLLEELDFSDIMVNDDFWNLYRLLKQERPQLVLHHGGEGVKPKRKASVHPATKLRNYVTRHNFRFIDFFNQFDKDHSMSVTREEFVLGIQNCGIQLTNAEVDILLNELDKDNDGEINYSEFAHLAMIAH